MKEIPYVSIVMPLRNEGRYLEKCLHCVLGQDFPAEKMEIIVADGMSEDGTRAIMEEMKKTRGNFKIIDNPKKIVASGLNELIKHARGEIIVRVDGHCEIAPDYVSRAVELFEKNPQAAGVGGPIETVGQDWISEAVAVAMSSNFGVGGSAFRTLKNKEMYSDTIPFPAYRLEIIEKAGPYDEELVRNQDDEYNFRLRKMGFKVLLSPLMKSRYYSRASIGKLFRQYFQYGYWKVRVLQKHPMQMQVRHFVPFAFVAFVTGLLVMSLADSAYLPAFTFLIFIYGTANLLASAMISVKSGFKYFAVLPVIYLVLHVSYGLGFAAGLLRFWNRWGKQ